LGNLCDGKSNKKPKIKSLGEFDFTQTRFSDDNFIEAGLGGMGYSWRLQIY
jgi:hypothetical protein